MAEKSLITELWTISDVLKFAKIKSRNTVYEAIRDGLPVIRTGRLIRFNPESVKTYYYGREH